ncbi:MAG TPA: hypothetical protein VFW40_14655, partial [Capsulimonadaceae bacterium]|nr:hypothetical protein [Capsulimonadaceae bacterium]
FFPIRYEETVKGYLSKHPASVPLQKGTFTSYPKDARVIIFKNQHFTKEQPHPQWADGSSVYLSSGGYIVYNWLFVLNERETSEERAIDDPLTRAFFDAMFRPESPMRNQQWQFSLIVRFAQHNPYSR